MPLPVGPPTVLSDPNRPTPPWPQNFLTRTIHPGRRATFFWGNPYPQEPWISRREYFRLTVMRESARIQLLSILPPPPTGARRFFWPEPARPREPRAPRAYHAPSAHKAGNTECRNNPAPGILVHIGTTSPVRSCRWAEHACGSTLIMRIYGTNGGEPPPSGT